MKGLGWKVFSVMFIPNTTFFPRTKSFTTLSLTLIEEEKESHTNLDLLDMKQARRSIRNTSLDMLHTFLCIHTCF